MSSGLHVIYLYLECVGTKSPGEGYGGIALGALPF